MPFKLLFIGILIIVSNFVFDKNIPISLKPS